MADGVASFHSFFCVLFYTCRSWSAITSHIYQYRLVVMLLDQAVSTCINTTKWPLVLLLLTMVIKPHAVMHTVYQQQLDNFIL